MKRGDKKLIYSVVGAILFIVVVIVLSSLLIKGDNNIYLTLYSPIDNYKKVIKTKKGEDIYNKLSEHSIDGYEFVGWFYDNDLTMKVNEGTYFNKSQILKAGYSKIYIKDESGFYENFETQKYITIRTKNSKLTNKDIEDLLKTNVEYLDLSNAEIESGYLKECLFCNYSCLKEINLPKNLIKIEKEVFKNCYNLEKVKINSSIKNINNEAFYNCLKLKEINLENVEQLSDYIFAGCSSLKEINLGENLKVVSNKSFDLSFLNNVNLNNKNENFVINKNILYTIDYKLLIKAFNNIDSVVQINNNVEVINENAFNNNKKLSEITFSDNLKVIKNNAFNGCLNLKKATFKDNTHYDIEDGVFSNCESVEEIKFTLGLNSLGDKCFYNCLNLKNVEFNNSTNINISNLKSIGDSCFKNCKNLEFFVMLDSVENLGSCVFENCLNLKIVHLSSRIKNIPSKTFYNNNSLIKVVSDIGVLSIGKSCFEGCKKLEDISTLKNVYDIDERSFKGCEKLETINFDNIEIINKESFYNCLNLKNISIKNVKKINEYGFYGCKALTNFNIEKNIELISQTAFKDCYSLEEFNSTENSFYSTNNGVLYNKSFNSLICYPQGKKDLSFNLLNSVNKIECETIYYNLYLKEINVSDENLYFSSKDGVLYNKNKTELMVYPANKQDLEHSVIKSVETIKSKAFSNNKYLKELTVLENVLIIEKGALNNLSSLNKLELPFIGLNINENKFLGYIFGSDSYVNNFMFVSKSLESVIVTKDTVIDDYCFYDLKNVTYIKYNNAKKINNYAFYNNENVKEFYLDGNIELIEEETFINVKNLKKLTFGYNENLTIKKNSFDGLKYDLQVQILYDDYVDKDKKTELKNKFKNVYKRAESWDWDFKKSPLFCLKK